MVTILKGASSSAAGCTEKQTRPSCLALFPRELFVWKAEKKRDHKWQKESTNVLEFQWTPPPKGWSKLFTFGFDAGVEIITPSLMGQSVPLSIDVVTLEV